MRRRITAAAIAATVGLGGLAPVALATGDCPPSKPTKVVETPKPAKKATKAKKAKKAKKDGAEEGAKKEEAAPAPAEKK